MRILMIGEYKPRIEGPANVVVNLSAQLSKEHTVSVICFEHPSYAMGLGHWVDGKVDVWQERILYPGAFVFVQGWLQKTKRAFRLRKSVDVYHAHGYLDALIGLIDRSKPLVITYHGLPIQEALAAGWLREGTLELHIYQAIERAVLRRADAVIVLNGRIRQWMLTQQKIDASKLFTIPNGVDISSFNPGSENVQADAEGPERPPRRIVFVKRLNEQSGVTYLVQSMITIKERFPDAQLILVGDGPLREELERTVQANHLEGNVRFIGRVTNDSVPQYLRESDIYVLPSVPQGEAEETFSLSLIEAMACGKAVIATSIGGNKEILGNSKEIGVLVPPKDPDAIAMEVIRLLNDPARIKRMGENARNFVISSLTWNKVAASTVEVYRSAMRER